LKGYQLDHPIKNKLHCINVLTLNIYEFVIFTPTLFFSV